MISTSRKLSPEEIEAWEEYAKVLDRLHEEHNVKMYDRVSIHDAFPELDEAFEHVLAVKTFCRLKYETQEE
jgi:cupin superfamily acireductone dioxygenase involved in methionine salvage